MRFVPKSCAPTVPLAVITTLAFSFLCLPVLLLLVLSPGSDKGCIYWSPPKFTSAFITQDC